MNGHQLMTVATMRDARTDWRGKMRFDSIALVCLEIRDCWIPDAKSSLRTTLNPSLRLQSATS